MKSKSLVARLRQVTAVEKTIIENGGELTEELEKSLMLSELSLKEKVDAYAFVMENLKQRSEYWDEKASLLKKYGRTCANIVERMRENLKANMFLEGKDEILGKEIRFVLQGSNSSLKINESEVPAEYFRTEITRTVDREKVRKALMNGEEVPGVQKVEGYALRSYPNHSAPMKKKAKKKGIKNEQSAIAAK